MIDYYHKITRYDYCICGGLLQWTWLRDGIAVRTCDRCHQNIPALITTSTGSTMMNPKKEGE